VSDNKHYALVLCEVMKFRLLASLQNTVIWSRKTASYGVVLCTRGRCERDSRRVLATRVCDIDERQYDRSKFAT